MRREHHEADSLFLGVNAVLLLVLCNIFIFASGRRLFDMNWPRERTWRPAPHCWVGEKQGSHRADLLSQGLSVLPASSGIAFW